MANEAYLKLLRDPRWQRLRLEVMKRDDFMCTSCMDTEKTLHIHHKKYVKGKPWESPHEDLTTLCEVCHEEITKTLPMAREALSYLDARTLTRVYGMVLAVAFKRRDPSVMRVVEISDYEMADGFAKEVGWITDRFTMLLDRGKIDLKDLARQEDERSARLDAEYMAPGGGHEQWLKERKE